MCANCEGVGCFGVWPNVVFSQGAHALGALGSGIWRSAIQHPGYKTYNISLIKTQVLIQIWETRCSGHISTNPGRLESKSRPFIAMSSCNYHFPTTRD